MTKMKTATEKKNLKIDPLNKFSRYNSLNISKAKFVLILFLVLQILKVSAKTDAKSHLWQYTFSSGVHSFYAPIENLKWHSPGFAISGEINRMLGQKQLFSAGFQLQYGQNRYQGDATSLQFLGQFLPVVFKKIELGVGSGAGYRFSAYPSSTLKWDGNQWEESKKYKGIFQVPFQLSTGYRSINFSPVLVTPFIAYQMQAMIGYNPDLSPLPDSSIMFGFKFNFK